MIRPECPRNSGRIIAIERLTSSKSSVVTWFSLADRLAAMIYSNLCAYQFLFELGPTGVSDTAVVDQD